jgi:hypothetical protein
LLANWKKPGTQSANQILGLFPNWTSVGRQYIAEIEAAEAGSVAKA